MSANHTYPAMSPQDATKILAEPRPAGSVAHDKYERTVPPLKAGTNVFTYTADLENRLKEVARKFAEELESSMLGQGSQTEEVWFRTQCAHSVAWYTQLRDLPVAVVEDDSFWRYLTVAVLGAEEAIRSYIAGKAIHIGSMSSNVQDDGSTRRSSDILAKRMYARGYLYPEGPPVTNQEFETSHVFPGNAADTRSTWQKAMYATYGEEASAVGESDNDLSIQDRRRTATKVNAARSARVASATTADEAVKLAKRLQ